MSADRRAGAREETLRRDIDLLDSRTLRWAVDLARLVRDPMFPAMVIAALTVLIAGGLLVVTGVQAGDQQYLSLQLPYLVSGGLAAVGVLLIGTFGISILGERRTQAHHDSDFREVVDEAATVTRLVLARRAARRSARAGSR
ncbi:MAG: hypothetical protein F2667_11365 [Actinobacteria bacterium]|uniref:Unannotated protein n=1 Tax=freshwater metagenome TaxID=449393 RepID=A0A6J6RMT4_9ZZZZ|nr:hypothetical protein [Actinomycetota bacterium]